MASGGPQAAPVVAAAHDLGKLVAYRRVGPRAGSGSARRRTTALSAILLEQCPSWQALASAETREAILQCLVSEHAPEGLSANAPRLRGHSSTALRRADAAAAHESGAGRTGPRRDRADAA